MAPATLAPPPPRTRPAAARRGPAGAAAGRPVAERPGVRPAPAREARRPAADPPGLTLADLAEKFGPMPAHRLVTDPRPGTATDEDWEAANRRGDGLYELIDGTLIRKAVSDLSSWLGGELFRLLANFVTEHRLGYVHPADGYFRLPDGLRAPDASFTPFADRPGGLQARGYSDVPPALVVEALSPGNTRREMDLKRTIYFAAGVRLVWEADPLHETVAVWAAPDDRRDLSADAGDALTGAPVLPGFGVPLVDLFTPPAPPAAADAGGGPPAAD